MLNEHVLQVFLKVYQLESIHQAAQALFVSQQSVSKTILDLEEELGEKLFLRNHRQLVPTPEALRLKLHAERILEEYRSIRRSISAEAPRQELKVYCTCGVPEYLGAAFVREFSQFRPDILLYLIELPDRHTQEILRTRDIALAIMSDPCDPSLFHQQELFTVSYAYVMSPDDPLAELPQISAQDVASHAIVGKGSEFQRYIDQMSLFSASDNSPFVIFETTSYHLAMQIAREGLAVAFVPDHLADDYAPQGSIVVPATPGEVIKPFYLTTVKGARLREEQLDFIRFLKEYCARKTH